MKWHLMNVNNYANPYFSQAAISLAQSIPNVNPLGSIFDQSSPDIEFKRPLRPHRHADAKQKQRLSPVQIIEELQVLGTGLRPISKSEREQRWLNENRHRFTGQWIAIEGDELLASGPTAREVYRKVANRSEPPLVIQIETKSITFPGW